MADKDKYLDLIHVSTASRSNEKWLLKNTELKEAVENLPAEEKIINFADTFSHLSTDTALFQDCFLQIVTETAYNYPVPFFSEKFIKPILNKRPFVIIGAANSLASLQAMGFKTFSEFWSEDYDTIEDPELRLIEIFNVIESLCAKSIHELRNLCIAMSDILNYNFDYLKNDFKKNQLMQFEAQCIKNLQPRYD